MKAIIVPGVTDLNKGDQALVWESHRLLKDTGIFKEIFILTNGDTEEEEDSLCSQSKEKGLPFVDNILKHPRRGKHPLAEHIKESKLSLLLQVFHAFNDLISRTFLLIICNSPIFVSFFFGEKVCRTVKAFKDADMIFVKGGGFIHAYGERTAAYLMWFFLFYIRLAKRLNKKVVIFPNSFGPFEGLTVKRQIVNVLKNVEIIYAREKVSSEKLSELLNNRIPVEMDLGFFLESGDTYKSHLLLEKYGFNDNDRIVGVTIRPWRFPGKEDPQRLYENYLNSVKKLIDHITKSGYKVALCNQSLGPNSHEDDRNAIKELMKDNFNKDIIWVNENLACDDLKALYSNFYFFIGTRFHSVIFSMTSLVPSIAIGYGGNKAKGIMGDFNLNEYVIQIDKVNAKELVEMFNHAVVNYDRIKNKLQKNIGKVYESRDRIINDIKELIIS